MKESVAINGRGKKLRLPVARVGKPAGVLLPSHTTESFFSLPDRRKLSLQARATLLPAVQKHFLFFYVLPYE